MEFNLTSSRELLPKLPMNQLTVIISELQQTSPGIGVTMVEGKITGRGLRSTRADIADALA